MCVSWRVQRDDTFQILFICSGVSDLFLSKEVMDHTFLPLLAAMPLARLSASLETLFDSVIDFAHPLFARLTHLDNFNVYSSDKYPPVDFGRLPCLTHISFNFPHTWAFKSHRSFFEGVLANSVALKVFILLTYGDDEARGVMSQYRYFGDDTVPLSWTEEISVGIGRWERKAALTTGSARRGLLCKGGPEKFHRRLVERQTWHIHALSRMMTSIRNAVENTR
ncbi:hypothetical protein B0H11DRAFT_1914626 [Mycena galericulata]|nr:hypothetical protein B0H11DRAFT_1914626 [Mycena galericulata]